MLNMLPRYVKYVAPFSYTDTFFNEISAKIVFFYVLT